MFSFIGNMFSSNAVDDNQTSPQSTQPMDYAAAVKGATDMIVDDDQMQQQRPTQQPEDWVIVDTGDDKATSMNKSNLKRDNTSEQNKSVAMEHEQIVKPQATIERDESDFDNEVLLGSFFEKNEHDDDEEQNFNYASNKQMQIQDEQPEQKVQEQPKQPINCWLVTPLPCLHASQSSKDSNESDQLENLLIEQPNVFLPVQKEERPVIEQRPVVVQTVQNKPDESPKQKQQKTKKAKKVEKMPTPSPLAVVVVTYPSQKPAAKVPAPAPAKAPVPVPASVVKAPVPVPVVVKKSEPVAIVAPVVAQPEVRKSTAEKRKPVSPVMSAEVSPSVSPSLPKRMSARKNKKTSTRLSAISHNKENSIQVKQYLLNDFKKINACARMESMAGCNAAISGLNNNQIKRNNKNVNLSKNVNHKQRKYHKLQQPVLTSMQF